MANGLIVGGHIGYLGKLAEEVPAEDILLFIAASLDDVKRIIENETIDIVILGLENDPEYRLQILRHIFAVSPNTSIHIKEVGLEAVPFICKVLELIY